MKKIHHPTDNLINRIQDAVIADLSTIQSNPLSQAKTISNVKLVATQTTPVSHGLGRRPVAWFHCGSRTPFLSLYETNDSDSNYLYLRSSNDVVTTLIVF